MNIHGRGRYIVHLRKRWPKWQLLPSTSLTIWHLEIHRTSSATLSDSYNYHSLFLDGETESEASCNIFSKNSLRASEMAEVPFRTSVPWPPNGGGLLLLLELLQDRIRLACVMSGSVPQQYQGRWCNRAQRVHASMLGLPSNGTVTLIGGKQTSMQELKAHFLDHGALGRTLVLEGHCCCERHQDLYSLHSLWKLIPYPGFSAPLHSWFIWMDESVLPVTVLYHESVWWHPWPLPLDWQVFP